MKYLVLSVFLMSCAGNVSKVTLPNGEIGYEMVCSEVNECEKQAIEFCSPKQFSYVFVRKESEYQYTSRITCNDEIKWN